MQTSELTHNRHVVSTFECQTCLTRFFAWNLLETSFGCRCVANDCETYLKRLSVADVCPMIAKPTWNVFRLQMCAQWLRNLLETSFGCRCVPNDWQLITDCKNYKCYWAKVTGSVIFGWSYVIFFTLYLCLCLGIGKKGNRRVGEKFWGGKEGDVTLGNLSMFAGLHVHMWNV